MSIPVLCPKCEFAMEQPTGLTVPSNCPACGQRLTCPRCGSTLHGTGEETARLQCTECHLDLADAETVPLPIGADAAPVSIVQFPGFELRGEVGRGGMGIVYRAHQLSLHRDVAIKVLPPALASNRSALERFRMEATLAGRIVDAHILPVFDVQEVDGIPVIVMPFIEGYDLGRMVRDRVALRRGKPPDAPHPWAHLDDRAYLEKIFPLLDQLIAAVKALHGGGVLHRDIKPSNVLVDHKGGVWLSDFGLARLDEDGGGTVLGQAIGTAAYSSPEQARGAAEVDFRADLFSVGVTIYQLLTLELPFGKHGAQGTEVTPPRPSLRQPLLSRDFDDVILKAIQRDPQKRYGSLAELDEDWRRAREGLLPKASKVGSMRRAARALRRHPWRVTTAALILLLGVALGVAALPRDPTEYRNVYVETNPAGADVVLVPLDPQTGYPTPEHSVRAPAVTPVIVRRVPVGSYFVVAIMGDDRFHEVFRTVPREGQPPGEYIHQGWSEGYDGVVNINTIQIPQASVTTGMTTFAAGDVVTGGAVGTVAYPHYVAPFLLDPAEVTLASWRAGRRELPIALRDAPPPPDFAITYVSFDQAVDFAETVGKRLPYEDEIEFAATNGGSTRFPWGNTDKINGWPRGPVRTPSFDQTPTIPPVFGLYSNVAEWTMSWNVPYPSADPALRKRFFAHQLVADFQSERIVRGGPMEVIRGDTELKAKTSSPLDPRFRHGVSHQATHPGLGFRCARSEKPRYH
jgi:eukaryotic-like serine/threonine-protein kinase